MNARQLLAQLASDIELGEGSRTDDRQMTVGAFGPGVFVEVGAMTCTLSASDASSIAAWLEREETGIREWETELGVTCRMVGLGQGEVQVDLLGDVDEDEDYLWHGSADLLRESLCHVLVLASLS